MSSSPLAGYWRMTAALTRKKLLQESAYRIQFVGWSLAPFLFIAPYIYQARFFAEAAPGGADQFASLSGAADYAAFIAIGAAMYHWVVNIMWEIGFSWRDEQEEGTLEQLWLTPAPRWLLVLGNSAAHSAINTLTTLGILLLSHLLFGFTFAVNWLLLLAVSTLSWLSLYGIGFVWAGIVMFLKNAQQVISLGNDAMMMISGATFPLSILPIWMRKMAKLTPLAWVLSALRAVLLEGAGWGDIRTEILVLLAMAILSPALGFWMFNILEDATRRRASLGGY